MRIPVPNPIGSGDHPDPPYQKSGLSRALLWIAPPRPTNSRGPRPCTVPLWKVNWKNNKGVGVVPTPDGVWHRDCHYRIEFIGGIHKIQIVIRELLEELLRNFNGEENKGSGAFRPP